MRVALVTSTELPRPDHDLPVLVGAFAERGIEAVPVPWDEPGADWSAFDVAIVRSTWNYIARFGEFLAWIDRAACATRLVNPRGALLWNLHKRYLVELAEAGIAVVPTEVVPAGVEPDWDALLDGHHARRGDLVVKPAVSAGSFATVRVARGDRARAEEHRAAHLDRDMLVQPLIPSVLARGETNLVHFGGRFSHAVHKGARWAGDLEQSRGLADPTRAELELAKAVLGHLEGCGLGRPAYARVDVAHAEDGTPLLMELEIVEPSLFLERAPAQAARFVDAVLGDGTRADVPR